MGNGAPLDAVTKSTGFGGPTHEELNPAGLDSWPRPDSVQSLLETHLDGRLRPPGAPSDFASFTDQQVVGLKLVLGAFVIGEVH